MTETLAPVQSDTALALRQDLLALRDLLAREDVEGARVLAGQLASKWPAEERVQHYARVLAPPAARLAPGGPDRPLDLEYAWLRAHARDYPGCWIAVFEDQLVAADPDLNLVLSVVRAAPGAEDALLHFQP